MSEWTRWGWYAVVLVSYATFSLLIFDYTWRSAQIRFRRLALYGGALWSTGLIAILAVAL